MKSPAAPRRRLPWSGCDWRRTIAATFICAFAVIARPRLARMLRRFWRWRRRATRIAPHGLQADLKGLRPDPEAAARLKQKQQSAAYSPANGFHRDRFQQRKG